MYLDNERSGDTAKGQPRMDSEQGNTAWNKLRQRLRAELGEDVFSSWFARMELERIDGDMAHVSVPTRFLKSWIETHYVERLRMLMSSELGVEGGFLVEVRTVNRDQTRSAQSARQAISPIAPAPRAAAPQLPQSTMLTDHLGSPLDRRLSLTSFVVGRSNALAFASAERIAALVGQPSPYNPLYLHAGVGLGKTHLVQAVAQEAIRLGKKVAYFTADKFMYGFVSALKSQTALTFKEQLRGIDLLVIDDAQFIQGRSVQQEFGHTINALIDAGKQVVVAADRLPSELESLDERVRSRLAGGLVVEIGTLDEELRLKILAARLNTLSILHPTFQVTPEVAAYVAHSIVTNGRDLDGAANRLLAHSTLSGASLTIETAEAAIRDLVRLREPKRVRIEDIQKLVAARYNVSRADILSERRTAAVVKPRQIAMYLSKSLTLRSLPEIGRRFGGRDHTTVLHAVRKIEKALGDDRTLTEEVELLKRMLMD
ncbi:MAG: chromosomal replication initiator protein DnaA [Bosea sp. (in: a-proteobacteria)]